jgi:hypothetical protein
MLVGGENRFTGRCRSSEVEILSEQISNFDIQKEGGWISELDE